MRGTRGVSLPEALVAALLVSIVLVAAGAMLSQIGAARTARRKVAERRRPHGRRARPARARAAGGREGDGRGGGREIELDLASGSHVIWRQDGPRLLRATLAPDVGHGRPADPVERVVLDGLLLVDLRRRSQHLVEVALRRRDEPLRRRTVLLRNVARDEELEP